MKKIDKIYNHKVIEVFYILLPLVEIVTTYMVRTMNTSLTLGVIYKSIFLIYCVLYLLFVDKKKRIINYIMLGTLFVFGITNFFVTINGFSFSNILFKITAVSKYITLPIALLFLYKYSLNGNRISLKTLVYSGLGYGLIMVVAKLTGTEIATYDSGTQYGHSGWFYSGNEISVMAAMFYPLAIYYASKKREKLMIISLAVLTYTLLAIGTKTAFVALVITIISILIFELLKYIIQKDKLSKRILITLTILIAITAICAPVSPTFKYISKRFEKAKTQTQEIIDTNKDKEESSVTQNFIFNGRNKYMKIQLDMYKDTTILEKLFGMNDGSKYVYEDGTYCTIERDLFDIFFMYGIVGLVIYYIPIIYVLYMFAKRIFANFKEECNSKNFVIGVSIVIALGTSYIAGHVLLATTVALFFSVILANLNYIEKIDRRK